MICPRCQAALLRTERSGSVCSRCRRPFALDPKVHGRGMHDTRILHAVEKLTDKGRRQITVSQLRYLARSANPHWEATPESGRRPWIGRTVGAVLLAWLVALAVALRGVPSPASSGGRAWRCPSSCTWWRGASGTGPGAAPPDMWSPRCGTSGR